MLWYPRWPRNIECGVDAAAQEEAVEPAGILVIPDDLTRTVDAFCNGEVVGQGIIESEVGGKTPRLGSYRKSPLLSV